MAYPENMVSYPDTFLGLFGKVKPYIFLSYIVDLFGMFNSASYLARVLCYSNYFFRYTYHISIDYD